MKFRINYNEVKKLKEFGVENYEIDRLENKMIDIVYYLGLSGKDLSYRFIVNKYEVNVDFCSREIIENVLFEKLVSYYKNVKMNIDYDVLFKNVGRINFKWELIKDFLNRHPIERGKNLYKIKLFTLKMKRKEKIEKDEKNNVGFNGFWNVLKDEEIGRFLYNWRIKKGYRDNLNNVWLRKMRYGRY